MLGLLLFKYFGVRVQHFYYSECQRVPLVLEHSTETMDECTGHSHDHDHEENAVGLSLFKYFDLPSVSCLNEEVAGSGRAILKPHQDRLTATPALQSPDDDPELLLYIPFTEAIKAQSIAIHNAGDGASARRGKIFVDRDDLDFDTAREMTPAQSLELVPPGHFTEGTIHYPLRPAGRFQNIQSLAVFVESNFEDDDSATHISFVGLKGKGTSIKRQAVETVYESRGMKKDHKVPDGELGGQNLI